LARGLRPQYGPVDLRWFGTPEQIKPAQSIELMNLIYGTTASPVGKPTWGRVTQKQGPAGTTLYLHIFDWPADGRLVLPGLRGEVASATLLGGGVLRATRDADGIVLTQLPATAPDPISTTIVVRLK